MIGHRLREAAASGHDHSVGAMARRIVPSLPRAARLAPGQRVLDIATGTGPAAEAAAAAVGPTGHVVASDISPPVLEPARERIGALPNVSFSVEDGQDLGFRDGGFDAVLCNLGLMHSPNPVRGLSEFRRVLRPGGRAAVSVFTRADRALAGGLVRAAIARRVPSKAAAADRFFSLGDEGRLRAHLEAAGFAGVETGTETLPFRFPSFDAYFGGVEQGAGRTGQEYTTLPEEVRRAGREEVRREVGDTGGPVEVEVEVRVASGWR